MTISNISVTNFKGLRDINVPLSKFSCIIGENNAGKSSFMQALLLFLKGNKLSPNDDYYDNTKDVLMTVEFSDISDDELERLGDGHKNKLKKYINNGKLILARRYTTDGKSTLRNVGYFPIEPKFNADQINEVLKGKKPNEVKNVLETFYSEINLTAQGEIKTITKAKEIIQNYVDNDMELSKKELNDKVLDSGFDNTITAFFPEPIYIPAVKDLSDDMKTKEGATFGKLLNILLDVIEEDLEDEKILFENLRKRLNKLYDEDGNVSDDRIEKIKKVEETIQKNLNETFKNISIELQIPQPEIKTILSSASIMADDGVKSSVTNKGDGFKRAITFSILRSYVELAHNQDWQKEKY